eukprot:SAG22_NODE_10696_length_520_cov_1.197150_1_plen_154_part_01
MPGPTVWAASGAGRAGGAMGGGGGAWHDQAAMACARHVSDGVLINKMIPLLAMRHKVQRARLQQLLALVPPDGEPDPMLLSRLKMEVTNCMEKRNQQRQVRSRGPQDSPGPPFRAHACALCPSRLPFVFLKSTNRLRGPGLQSYTHTIIHTNTQ